MLYDNIMVPYDGSPSAQTALDEAVRFAKDDPGATLHIMQIVDIEKLVIDKLDKPGYRGSVAATTEELRALREEATQHADARLRRQVAGSVHDLMNEVVIAVLDETTPGEQIVNYAIDHDCDLIIMGSRGLGALRGMLGSVSSHVLRHADVPVMVVKAD